MAGEKGENFLTIYTNDGNTILKNNTDCGDDITTLQVTAESIISDQKGTVYTYSGNGIFKGVATYANATEAAYPVGTTFTFGKDTPNEDIKQYLTLYIVEEEKPKITKTFDLSTLNLSAGTHEITVKARASGYADSPASNAVSYVVQTETFTIQVPVYAEKGYYYEETLSLTISSGQTWREWIESTDFIFQGSSLSIDSNNRILGSGSYYLYYDSYGGNYVLADDVISQTAIYKLISYNTVSPSIEFTIDGTTYHAEEGMTWGEWVESGYNTGGWMVNDSGQIYKYVDTVPNRVGDSAFNIITANYNYSVTHGGDSN